MISFTTPGLIDMRAFTHFGVNAKENTNPIGYFGTGLKYALAVLARHDARVTINRGGQDYTLRVRPGNMRGKEFSFIDLVSGDEVIELPFTTELGKNWELWMAFRELYSNTLDENGMVLEKMPSVDESNVTVIVVDHPEFDAIWAEKGEYFLDTKGRTPLARLKDIEIYRRCTAQGAIFMQGIRVGTTDGDSLFTYNLTKNKRLTEDRALADDSAFRMTIVGQLRELDSTHEKFLREILVAPSRSYEGRLDHRFGLNYDKATDFYNGFVSNLVRDRVAGLNPTLAGYVRLYNIDGGVAPDEVQPSELDTRRLTKAISFCKSLGFLVDKYPIRVFAPGDSSLLGMAIDGQIWVSAQSFRQGTKNLAGTLIEEYIHLEHGLQDETRGLQNFLVDTVVSFGERIIGEPL
jgi:hypothetical protein